MPEHHWIRKNRICLVKYSCDEVSGPSEVPWFVGKLVLKLFKKVNLASVCSIISCLLKISSDGRKVLVSIMRMFLAILRMFFVSLKYLE